MLVLPWWRIGKTGCVSLTGVLLTPQVVFAIRLTMLARACSMLLSFTSCGGIGRKIRFLYLFPNDIFQLSHMCHAIYLSYNFVVQNWIQNMLNAYIWIKMLAWMCNNTNVLIDGPLTRYMKLWVAHVSGMPGTFSPPPTSKETTS